MKELSSDGEGVGYCCHFFVGDFNEGSGKNVIGILLDDGKSRFCGNVGKGVFLFVFVAVGTLCGQELMYCRTELGSGILIERVVVIGGRGGLFKVSEVSCVFGIVGVSSLGSESGEFVSKNVRFREIRCD